MKRILKSSIPPKKLTEFVKRHPVGDCTHQWSKARSVKKEVQHQVYSDQRGLCAYCEIKLTFTPPHKSSDAPIGDIRIEHFHPESDTTQDWAFMWSNMLGCCTGGSETNLTEPERVAKGEDDDDNEGRKRNQHCDVPKGNDVLDGIILNPLEIKTTRSLFSIKERIVSGKNGFLGSVLDLVPIKEVCDSENSRCYQMAKETIDRLHLNCDLLGKFRYAAVDALKEHQKDLMAKGYSPDDAIKFSMEETFDNTEDAQGHKPDWPPFFTAIRAYWGIFAENRLTEIGYEG